MDAEVDSSDDEVFEIDDFTVVSPLETLISAFELAIHEWGLHGARPFYGIQKRGASLRLEMSERIVAYESHTFRLRWYRPCEGAVVHSPSKASSLQSASPDDSLEFLDLSGSPRSSLDKQLEHLSSPALQLCSPDIDFSDQHAICAMYGVCEFLILSAVHAKNDRIATQEQKDFVISAVRPALINTQCEIAFFVLCGDPERELYFGCAENRNTSIEFQPTHLYRLEHRHTNLTGLMLLLKEKVGAKASVMDLEEIKASVRFEYHFKEPERSRPRFTEHEPKMVRDCCDCRDSLKLSLICEWPFLSETRVHENDSFTNLEPADSPHWAIHSDFAPSYQPFANRLRCAIVMSKSESAPRASSLFTLPESDVDISPSKEPNPSSAAQAASASFHVPNDSDWRSRLGAHVMTEASDSDRLRPAWMKSTALNSAGLRDPLHVECIDILRQTKAAPVNSLAVRFAVEVSHVIDDETDVAAKWVAFTKLLRWHLDNGEPLPNMDDISTPNLGTCLLNQKLEMLHCCIQARRRSHLDFESVKDFSHDEFFDAEEEVAPDSEEANGRAPSVATGSSESSGSSGSSGGSRTPQGRRQQLGQLTLIHHPDTPLFVPHTQMLCPMTEDMVFAHTEHLASLRDGHERTEAQLGLLRTDMQAFKAANPLCDLVDFIRWHSPKDWDEERGELSERMRIPENAWERCWQEAQPLAAIHQERHFNEATVAEGILAMFEQATTAEIAEWLLPLLFFFATLQLISEDDRVREEGAARQLCEDVSRAARETPHLARRAYYVALQHLRDYERVAHFHFHLHRTFWRQQFLQREAEEQVIFALIKQLIAESKQNSSRLEDEALEGVAPSMFRRGVRLPGAYQHILGEVIAGDFQRQHGLLTRNQLPSRKSYTLYWRVSVPAESSRLHSQRLFAHFEPESKRLCAAFSKDAVFF